MTKTISKILCPVDLSDIARRALDYAIHVGRAHEATVQVVQVVDAGLPASTRPGPAVELTNEARVSLEDELTWFVAPALDAAVPTSVRVVEGRVVPEVLSAAVALPADLIVIGTHGRSGFERFVLGSVTEKLLRKASCPVLAIPHGEGAGPIAFRRILCATDFSKPSGAAVEWATSLAARFHANLSLVHVVEWSFGETRGDDPVSELRRSLEAQARADLAEVQKTAGTPPAEAVVLSGRPGREIHAYATEHAFDLVVIGVSGRGAIDRALLGSTAYQVLRDAPCPVMTVPLRD